MNESQKYETKNNIIASALNYAIPLGLFWVFKYLFVLLGKYSDLSLYIENVLRVGTPFILYIVLTQYRSKELGGYISFFKCFTFTILLFVFGSVLESAIMYVHYAIIDPQIITKVANEAIQMAKSFNYPKDLIENMKIQLTQYGSFYAVFGNFMLNIIFGVAFGIVFGIVLSYSNKLQLPNSNE